MNYSEPELTVNPSSLPARDQRAEFPLVAKLWSVATSHTCLAILDQAVVSGSRFLMTIVIGRVCGTRELGVYALIFAVYLVFVNLQEALITTPYTVYGNRLKGPPRYALAGSALMHSLILSVIAMLIVGGAGLFMYYHLGRALLAPAMLTLAVAFPFMMLWEFARSLAFAHLNLIHALLLDGTTAALQIAGLACLAYGAGLSSAGGYLALGAGCAFSGIAWLLLSRRKLQPTRSAVASDWSKHWKFGRWVLAGQMVETLHGYTPAWVLVFSIGVSATGVFSACENIVLLSNPLMLAIVSLFGATTARAFADGGYSAVCNVVRVASMCSAAAMGVLWLVLVFVGERAVVLLYGNEFAGNGHVVSTIAFAAPLWAISSVMTVGLRAVERPETDVRARVAGLLVTLIASVLTVNLWGVQAVAYALVAGSASSALWQAYVFYRVVPAEERFADLRAK